MDIAARVGEHRILENLNGILSARVAAILVEGADEHWIVHLFRMTVVDDAHRATGEGHIGEGLAARFSKTEHRQHGAGICDALGPRQRAEGEEGKPQMDGRGETGNRKQIIIAYRPNRENESLAQSESGHERPSRS